MIRPRNLLKQSSVEFTTGVVGKTKRMINIIGNIIGNGSVGEEALDETVTFQDLFLADPGTQYETAFTPADVSGLEVWVPLSSVTGADIPEDDDALASVPNLGTGADMAMATEAQRPLFKTSVGEYVEPIWSGTYENTDSWYRHQLKCMRIVSGKRMTLTPVVQNPTYLEGYLVVNVTSGTSVIWSHRSENTRLIQVAVAGGKFIFQLRSSGGVIKTMTSTVNAFTGSIAIIYFRFNKTGNSHAISVNGETEVTDVTNFGAETFNSTHQTFGGYTVDAGANYQDGVVGNYHEIILKYSAFTAGDKADTLQYLRYKYINFGLSPANTYTPRANRVLINPGDALPAIVADTYYKFSAGVHELPISENEAQLYVGVSNVSIELAEGAEFKLPDDATELGEPELIQNQFAAADMSISGTYTGLNGVQIWVRIDGTGTPNTFKWTLQDADVNGHPPSYDHEDVPITGAAQLLSDGISVTFNGTTGHTLDSGAIISIGAEYYGIRVGTGFHTDYIEDVKIFGPGKINLNQTNNADFNIHSFNMPSAVLIHGRVRNWGVYGITIEDTHRKVQAYGDHNGTYEDFGATSGGEAFNAEFGDIMEVTIPFEDAGAGCLLGHPEHRGFSKYVRAERCNTDTYYNCWEPNFNLENWRLVDSTVRSRNTTITEHPIHCWRHSQDGIIANNIQSGEALADADIVHQNNPVGWEAPLNNIEYNNVTV